MYINNEQVKIMSDDKVVSMAEKMDDARLWTPKQALEDALNDIGVRGAFENGKKILIIALDESDGQYETNYIQAGMSSSECVALCEIAKTIFLREMNYI